MADPKSQISTLDTAPKVSAPVAAPDAQEIKGANFDEGMSGKMEIITIHSGQEENGTDAVNIGINGYLYQIPRDKPFKVPTEVAQILRDAVTIGYKPGPQGSVIERATPRYAFQSVPA